MHTEVILEMCRIAIVSVPSDMQQHLVLHHGSLLNVLAHLDTVP